MVDALKYTKLGQMPPSFDVLLGSHIHLGEITSFEDSDSGLRNPPQIVVGNSGTQFIAPTKPPKKIFDLKVKQTNTVYQYGYLLATKMEGGRGSAENGGGKRRGKSGKAKSGKEKKRRSLGGIFADDAEMKGKKDWWKMEFKVSSSGHFDIALLCKFSRSMFLLRLCIT